MKKQVSFLRKLPLKLYVLLAAVLLLAFFSNDFGLVDIQKTAIILAAGVDRQEEQFTLTAQVAVPKGGKDGSGTASVELTGTGRTVAECVQHLYTDTGWVPKFIFCDLVVLGEEAAKEDVFSCLDFFLRNEYMPDSCVLAVCEGRASELLASKSAVDDTSSFAVEKLFSDAAEKSGLVSKTTLKQFANGYYGVSKSGFMPYLRAKENAPTQGEGGQSGQGTSTPPTSAKVYSASQTALFYGGSLVRVLDERLTFAYNLVRGKVYAGTFTVADGQVTQSLTVLKDEGKAQIKGGETPQATLSLSLRVRVFNSDSPSTVKDLAESQISPSMQRAAEELLTAQLTELWAQTAQSGCDLFLLNRDLYRSSPKEYEKWKGELLSSAQLTVRTEVRAMR